MTKFNTPSKFLLLVTTLGVKTFRLRYRNSLLGFLWSLVNPLIYLLVFTLVFGNVFTGIDRYPHFVLCGLLCWIFFSTTTLQVMESVVNNRGVLKSIHVPTIAFPLSALHASILSMILTMIPFAVMMFYFGMRAGWEFLLAIPLLILFSSFTFGLSLVLTSLNVYFRDVQLAWTSFMPAIFYISPIAYAPKLIPGEYLWILKLNPLYYFIGGLRDLLYANTIPAINQWLILLFLGTVPLLIGIYLFNKLERGFVSQY